MPKYDAPSLHISKDCVRTSIGSSPMSRSHRARRAVPHIAQAQLEAKIPAHGATDDHGWKTVTVIERFRFLHHAILRHRLRNLTMPHEGRDACALAIGRQKTSRIRERRTNSRASARPLDRSALAATTWRAQSLFPPGNTMHHAHRDFFTPSMSGRAPVAIIVGAEQRVSSR
jgi:hypothetical protein